MKKYLFVGPDIVAGSDVVDIKDAIDWVDSPERATADFEAAAKETQKKFAELGINTELVEIPDKLQMESKWVICIED
jgi:hypothetical protein